MSLLSSAACRRWCPRSSAMQAYTHTVFSLCDFARPQKLLYNCTFFLVTCVALLYLSSIGGYRLLVHSSARLTSPWSAPSLPSLAFSSMRHLLNKYLTTPTQH